MKKIYYFRISDFFAAQPRLKEGFTLAEVLITLAIIGVVAAITIPSVIVNTNQMEFKTGLRKAVSVLNQAITINKALTGESPYDNSDLYHYLQQNMSVMKKAGIGYYSSQHGAIQTISNIAFYTTDGIKYEIWSPYGSSAYSFPLYESNLYARGGESYGDGQNQSSGSIRGKCGSLGLAHNPDGTTNTPCIILVDVNGDRKPSPTNLVSNGIASVSSFTHSASSTDIFEVFSAGNNKYADPNGRLLTDIFSIMITDQGAIPYGVVAQKAMYQAQK